MRALTFGAYALVALMCVATLPARVHATVCYINLNMGFMDEEMVLGADIAATALNLAAATDFRLINIELGGNPAKKHVVTTVGNKLAACITAGQKILFDFHSAQNTKTYLRRMLAAAWAKLREGNGGAQTLRDAGRVVPARAKINIASCFPDNFEDVTVMELLIEEIGIRFDQNGGGQAQLRAARKDEYGQWLFGARGSAANIALIKTQNAAILALAQAQAALNLHKAGPQNPDPKLALAALLPLQRTLKLAQDAKVAADLALNGVNHDSSVVYAAGQATGWVVDTVVVNDAHQLTAKLLASPAWVFGAAGQQNHDTRKRSCYTGYQDTEATLGVAVTRSACVLGAVYDISPNSNAEKLAFPPVNAAGAPTPIAGGDTALLHKPLLMTWAQAFPDLAGHLRAIPNGDNPRIGFKAATTAVITMDQHHAPLLEAHSQARRVRASLKRKRKA